ncbi:MAG: translation initiation factor IF-3 [Endomicrobiales bacterium]|nr:translation initiation factor IF-3 [Endomicrobiales bacterium]
MRINYQIRVPQVRLIDEDGSQLGVKPTNEALKLAQERDKDLVEIAPMASPPVCKIVEYSKLKYEQAKKAKEARKKQKGGHLKEVRMRPNIGEHDLDVKLKHIREFLEEHDNVRVSIMYKGREKTHNELGLAIVDRIKNYIVDIGEMQGRPSMFGNRLIMNIMPSKIQKTPKSTN